MTPNTEKVAAIALAGAVIAGLVWWRSGEEPAPAASDEPSKGAGLTATVLFEKEGPEGYRSQLFFGLPSVVGLAAEKVAEVALRDARPELEAARQSGTDIGLVRQLQLKLGSNVTVLGAVEDEPGKAGQGKLLATLYLVHAGPFPKAHATERHQQVCLVVEVDPAGDAYAGGLRPGDVWVQAGATDLLGSADADPCKALTETSRATATGQKLPLVVFRAGQRTALELHKGSERLKFTAIPVPVLDADKTGS